MKKAFLRLLLVVMVVCWSTCLGADDEIKCLKSEFQCADGNCVPISWWCDGDDDCTDSSDERSCISLDSNDSTGQPTDAAVKCLDNELPCTDGKCIHRTWWCDGDEDCADASDEKFCNSNNLTQTTATATAVPTTMTTIMATTLKTQGPTVDPSCQRISSPIRNVCSRLGYTNTRLPNRFGHTNQDQIIRTLGGWSEAIRKQCSPLLEDFLCRVYIQPCDKDETQTCRVICNSVKKSCRRALRKLKIRWPSPLHCSKFPKKRCSRLSAEKPNTPPPKVKRPSIRAKSTRATEGIPKGPGCQKLTIQLCQGLQYNQTLYPNVLKHRTQSEASQEVYQFFPLIQIGCHKDFRMFLCSLYAPICTVMETPIPPCRSMCEQSKKGCEPLMNRYGFSWPEKLNCSNFPEFGNDVLCIGVSSNSKTDVVSPTTRLTTQPTKKVPSPPPPNIASPKTQQPTEEIPSPPPPKAPKTTARPKGINATAMSTTIASHPKKIKTILMTVQGVITSPNYPNPYPQETKYNWIIQLPDSYKAIKITMEKLRLEEDRNCIYDYIIIKDKMLNQVGPRHCGTYRYPYKVLVRGNKAIVNFVSDGSTSKAGFLIKYKGLNSVPSEEEEE